MNSNSEPPALPATFRPCAAAAILLAILGAATPASAQTAPLRAPVSDNVEPEYLVGAGDVLQVVVWKESDLSRDVTVRLDGRVTVPLLGDVDAAGRTPKRLSEEIAARLGKFIEAPQVTVGVSTAASSRFYVLGQVERAGEFPFTGRTTVLQALAIAGGFKDFAKTENILVIRRVKGVQTFLPVNYKKIEEAKDLMQNVSIAAGDTILVP